MRQLFTILVGGGSVFSSVTPVAGSSQAIALGLVPSGLTPVAFFPPTPAQILPALSVIFQETVAVKRKKRNVQRRKKWYHPQNNVPYHTLGCFLLLFMCIIVHFKT